MYIYLLVQCNKFKYKQANKTENEDYLETILVMIVSSDCSDTPCYWSKDGMSKLVTFVLKPEDDNISQASIV